MNILLAAVLIAGTTRILEVNSTAVPIRIDGNIEEAWRGADSATGFTEVWPDDGGEPSEPTTVYVLQDGANLYFAFRCGARQHRPVAQLYGLEEEVTVCLDPTDSRSNGYFFRVYGSGLFHDGLLLDDGSNWDWSWDCVWYSAVALHDDWFAVEIRIPFKSIRYRPDAAGWGVNFDRMIAATNERYVWQYASEEEGGPRVSNAGRLNGVDPQVHGYYFEVYPEGFTRYDEVPPTTGRVRPRGSLNLKWDFTPQASLNATVLPDFAQIEADPYAFNLSRYPTYFAERRPFFVEGSEFFRMAGSGNGQTALNTFYSRRIGKAVGQEPVPILGGLKLTARQGNSSFGAIGAFTDALTDTGGVEVEPRRGFGVLAGRTRIMEQTNAGLILSGTMASADDHNFALGGDWNLSTGPHNAVVQAAAAERSGKFGWGVNSTYSGLLGANVVTEGTFQAISDSFDVTDIGFVPWAGRVQFRAAAGPRVRGRGELVRLTAMPAVGFVREPGSDRLSYGAGLTANASLRSNWYIFLGGEAGTQAEADTQFATHSLNLGVEGGRLKYGLSAGGYAARSYNYGRGYVGYSASDWLFFTYYLGGRVALMLGGSNNWELDPENRVVGVTSVARPRIDFRITSKLSFNVYSEMVLMTPETRWGETRLGSNRVGFLFSWNFLPKSWLYVAFNDYRIGGDDRLTLASRIGAVKLRYLFYI